MRRVRIEQPIGQSHDADPVDDRVVELDEQRLLAVMEAIDEVELPQWSTPVRAPGHDHLDCLLELAVTARRGHFQAADVVRHVKVGGVDP